MSMDPDEPNRPYSTARRAILTWIGGGAKALGQDIDPATWLDSYAAEVWDEGQRHRDDGTVNPYYEGRPVESVSHEATLRVLGNLCTVHGSHRPTPTRTVKHHVFPQQYGGPTVPENLVLICDTGHYSVHAALDALLAGQTPPKVTRAELALARRGFDAIRLNHPPPTPVPGPPAGC